MLTPPGFLIGPTTLSLLGAVATGLDTSIEISAIGTLKAGDICLIWNGADESGGVDPPDVTPSGFTALRATVVNNRRVKLFAKILTGAEGTVTGLNGSNDESWACAVFRPDVPITSFTDNDTGNHQGTSGNPTAQNITTASASGLALAYAQFYASDATIDPRTTSPSMIETTIASFHYAHYKIYNASDAKSNISVDMDDESNGNVLQSGWLSFT